MGYMCCRRSSSIPKRGHSLRCEVLHMAEFYPQKARHLIKVRYVGIYSEACGFADPMCTATAECLFDFLLRTLGVLRSECYKGEINGTKILVRYCNASGGSYPCVSPTKKTRVRRKRRFQVPGGSIERLLQHNPAFFCFWYFGVHLVFSFSFQWFPPVLTLVFFLWVAPSTLLHPTRC